MTSHNGPPDAVLPDGKNVVEDAIDRLSKVAHLAAPHQLPDIITEFIPAFGGRDALAYLADLQQSVLVPFTGSQGPGPGEHLEQLPIDATVAGRCFRQVEVLVVHRGAAGDGAATGPSTVWVPLLNGTERLGVLAVEIDDSGADLPNGIRGDRLRLFASLFAELIVTKTMYGDTIVRVRRQGQMGLAAELQWSLLPPLTFSCREVTIAAVLEPAYEVAGDAVDYAVDAGIARLAIFDGMGHGLPSAQLATMAVTAYRHARRSGRSLIETCAELDETLLHLFGGTSFTTAMIAELDTRLGALRWISAGHPEPLLLRHGRLVRSLHVRPRPPLGVNLVGATVPTDPTIGHEQLEPGDCVLFYTDGVTEARAPNGDFFGEQRLADLVVRNLAAGLPAPETMRRVVRTLLEHQQGMLVDDASLVLVQWPTAPEPMLP